MNKYYKQAVPAVLSAILLTACGTSAQSAADAAPQSADVFAMDTYMNLKAYGENAAEALKDAEARILALEETLSVTHEASDISRLNHAKGEPVAVSADTASVLQTALKIGMESGGALRVSLYPVIRAWGFTTGVYQVPEEDTLHKLLQNCDDTAISVDGETVALPPEAEIDLGAVAKGYTGDVVTEIFRSYGISSAIINLGGNVQTLGSKPDGSAWTVGIADPFAPDSLLGTVAVTDKAVITSGNYERYFTADDGTVYWHIIDPQDGFPADNGLVSVTVIGSSGAECDALSTALFVEGTEKAVQHWRSKQNFEMILVTADGELLLTEGIAADFTAKKEMPCEVVYADEKP